MHLLICAHVLTVIPVNINCDMLVPKPKIENSCNVFPSGVHKKQNQQNKTKQKNYFYAKNY